MGNGNCLDCNCCQCSTCYTCFLQCERQWLAIFANRSATCYSRVGNAFQRQENGLFPFIWRAQDGAPAHNLNVVRNLLREQFGYRVVAANHSVKWPPRSPHSLWFLWCYLKNRVYTTPPQNREQLLQDQIRW